MTNPVDVQHHSRNVDLLWHRWINRRQDERHKNGESWEGDLYEWRDALTEAERIPIWLKRARTGTLPDQHKQCSRQNAVKIPENRLLCALGVDVLECPILKSLYESFAEFATDKFYQDVTADDADVIAGKTCAWHIYKTVFGIDSGRGGGIDTSEGYVQDEGDRMFWRNLYDNLSDRVP